MSLHYRKRRSRRKSDRVEAVQWRGFGFGQFPLQSNKRPCFPSWMPPLTGLMQDREGTFEGDDMLYPDPGEAWQLGGTGTIRICVAENTYHDAGIGDFIIRHPDGSLSTMPGRQFRETFKAV